MCNFVNAFVLIVSMKTHQTEQNLNLSNRSRPTGPKSLF